MESVVFDDFRLGEYGKLGSRQAGKAPGHFTGKNVVRYSSGLVGPRPGVKALAVTGLPNGKIRGLGLGIGAGWIVVNNTVYKFPTETAGASSAYTMTDSIAGAFTLPPACLDSVGVSFVSVYGDAMYKLTHSGTTCVKLASAPAARALALYGPVLVAGGIAANPNRLFFSDPGDPATWGALNYVDIGDTAAITSIHNFRTGLLVGKTSGEFFYVTGVLGATDVVRRLTNGGAPGDEAKCAPLGNDKIAYIASNRAYVELYNGAVANALAHLNFIGERFVFDSDETPHERVIRLVGPDDFLALSGIVATGATNRALLFAGDLPVGPVPTFHTWGQNIGAWAINYGTSSGEALLCKDGDGSHAPVVYAFISRLDRPGFTADLVTQPGDDSTTPFDAYLHLPEWWAAEGEEILVQEVIVDFRKWDTGSATNNHFDITVRALDRYNTADVNASGTLNFDEASGSASTSGVDDRRAFYFGEQGQGGGFEIYFDAITGVAIRSVIVRFSKLPPR